MDELTIINIDLNANLLFKILGIISDNPENIIFYDLLLELKMMDLNSETTNISVPFSLFNIKNIINILHNKQTGIFGDIFRDFMTVINTKDGERNEDLDYFISNLATEKDENLNSLLQNGKNLLRLNF